MKRRKHCGSRQTEMETIRVKKITDLNKGGASETE